MSGPGPTSSEEEARPARRRRRWLRRGLWTLGVLLALFAALHSPPARRAIGAALARLAGSALRGEVRLSKLDYRLWAGEASVEGVEIRTPRLEIDCARVEVAIGPVAGLRAAVDSPRVVVTQGPASGDGTGPEASRPWTVLRHLDELAVRGGALELRSRERTPWLRLDGVEAQVGRQEENLRGRARIADADIGWPAAGIRVEGLRAGAELVLETATGTLRVLQGSVTSDEATLEGRGQLRQIGPILASAEGGGRVDARLVQRLVPGLELAGSLDARVSFEKDPSGARGTLEVQAADFEAFDIGPWSGSIRGTLDDRRLEIDSVRLAGYRGRAEASGVLFLGDGPAAFDVRARALDLRSVVGTFVDEPPPLASSADGEVRVEIQDWDVDTLRGEGRVSLRPGSGKGWPVAGPVDVRLGGRTVSWAADGLRVRAAQVATEGSFSFSKELGLIYGLRLPQLETAPELLADAGIELPTLVLGGGLEVDGDVSGLLPDWHATARFSSEGVSIEDVDLGLEASLSVSRAGVEIRSFTAEGVDGRLTASGFVPLGDDGSWNVEGEAADLSLADALRLHGVPVPTTARGRVRVEGPRNDPSARFEIEARAEPGRTEPGAEAADSESAAPVNGPEDRLLAEGDVPPSAPPPREPATLRLSGNASRRGVVVDELTVAAGGGTVEGAGAWVRDGGPLEGRARIADVQLARLPWLPGPTKLGCLDSTLSGEAELAGRVDAPEGRLELRLAGTRCRDESFPDLDLEADLAGDEVRLAGRLGGEPLLSGRLSLDEQWPLHLSVELATLPLTRVLRTLPGAYRERRSLTVAGQASLELPLRAPGQLGYEARVEGLDGDLGRGGGSTGPFTVRGDRETVAIDGFDFRRGQSRLRADGELGLASDATTPLVFRGEIPLADVALLLPDVELEGDAIVNFTFGGRLERPDVTGEARLESGRGRVGPVALEDLTLEAVAREGVLTIRRARAGVAGGTISARAQLPIGPLAEGGHTLEFDLQAVDPGTLLPDRPGDPRLVAPLDVSGRIRATALALGAIEAEGEITAWSFEAGKETLVLEKPAGWRFVKGELALDDLRLRGSHGHLGLDGTWTPGGAVRLHLSGETDLALLNPMLGGGLRLSGSGRADLTVRGAVDDLALEGGASLEDVRAVLREPPVVISGMTGSIEARGDSLVLEARGAVGDGSLRVAGTVVPKRDGPEINLTLDAERVPLVYPEGLRSRSSGQIRLKGRQRRYSLEGDVTVHRALYERETDLASQSLDSVGAELRALDARGSILERVQLDVRVRLAEGLRIQNRQAELVADGAVVLLGDLLTPELNGSVSLRDGGTVKLSRATVRLSQGRVNLAGFPSQPLEIDVTGRTQVTGIQIDVGLSGPLDDLRTSLSSPNRSDLTQGDLATLILTGRTAQAAADQSGAIVAEEVAAALGSALNERLGGAIFIDVSRDESLIVQDTDPTQRFNIGIPIGERLYVIHSQALDRSGVRWILDFRPQGQFRVRLISDSDDTNAIEVSHGVDFDLWSRGRRREPKAPARPRVREIRFEGVSAEDAEELRRRARLGVGDGYDFFEGDEASRRLQKHLVDQGYRAALVEATEKAAGEGRVDVVFKIERGPRIEVSWAGDDPGRKRRTRFAGFWDTYLSLEETATRRARELRNELRAERYYQATVSADVEASEDRARVRFDVRRGPRGKGVDLEFEGNSTLSAESLAAVLPPRDETGFFALLEPQGATRLETALRTAGARAGFLSLESGRPREAFDPETGRLRVTVPIEEGERAALVRLDLPEEVQSLEGASPLDLELRVGEPFRIDAYVDDRGTLARWFRAQGFLDARLAGILEPAPGGLAVRFEVDTGPRPQVGAIRQVGDGKTRSSVVDRAVVLQPGDLIRPEDLALTRDHLSETRVFRSVDVRAEPTEDAGIRDLVVDLAERPDLSVEYKVRYETGRSRETAEESSTEESRGFQFGVGIEAANPFGRAHRYSVYGLAGKRRQLFGATFESQTFFGQRWRTQVFLFDDSERDFETSGITRRVQGLTFQQTKRWRSGLTGRRWHDRLRMQWGYGFRRTDYTDPETGGVVAGDRAGVANSLIGDSRDSVTDPHRGLFWTATVEPTLKALGSEKDYVRLYGQIFAYVPLGAKVVWAQGLRVGTVPGEDPLLLLDRRFKAGGATTVRGFAENALGPQYRGFPIGGQALFVFNQELRFPLALWNRLYGGVFYDAGNVWGLSGELDLRELRHNVGAGLRVMFPFGPVRLDWAWVLDPQEGEPRSRWQFALGHAF